MARSDSIGFFWQDLAKVKPPKKEKPKSIPPIRFWERPDYLPGLEEALGFQFDQYTDAELIQAAGKRERLIYDIEVYPNYCLFGFRGMDTGKVVVFEMDNVPGGRRLDLPKLKWILQSFCIVNFNGLHYDFPVTAVALGGYGTEALWDATDMIIQQELQAKVVYKKYKVKKLQVNQIDLIELTALGPGLKVCAGRLHAQRMQDLPFKAGSILSEQQIAILRRYWVNDLDNTELLYNSLTEQIKLREEMSLRFNVDLRSSSDAQMAEAIIGAEVRRITGRKHIEKTEVKPGTKYKFQVPHFIKYSTPLMNAVLDIIRNADFEVGMDGSIIMPPELAELVIEMNKCQYKIGIGGLHSREKSIAHIADEEYFIADTDATSYYPRLILNAGMSPPNIGQVFLKIYADLTAERITAKEAGDKVVAECLKIVLNGTFGKLGSMWSIVYAPNLLIQVTITGQLSILMLAERFELAGIEVTSINTDGIVVKCRRSMEAQFNAIVKQWGQDTGFGTEEIRYKATYSRDINNYIAIYETPQKGEVFKLKGVYGKTSSKKNAVTEVCIDAIKEFISTGKPLEDTIRACRDIRRFTTMRAVSGGAVQGDPVPHGEAVKSGVYLGKVIRWYYATGEQGKLIYAKTGNRVASSEGAKPCMDLPDEFPSDIDYDWYVRETQKILTKIGYHSGEIGPENNDENMLPDLIAA